MELTPDELAAARRGDRAAQARVVDVYQQRIYAVCRALARDDGRDCAHDALIKLLTHLDQYEGTTAALAGFALRIARNVCIDRARRAIVRRPADVDIDAIRVVDREPASALDRERMAQVRAAVLALPDDQRAAVALRMWGELDYQEIAAIEGVAVGTIRSRLSRARDALRTRLAALEVAHAG